MTSSHKGIRLARLVLLYLGVFAIAVVVALRVHSRAAARDRTATSASAAPAKPAAPTDTSRSAPPASDTAAVTVASVRGSVERSAGSPEGWEPLVTGAQLAADESLRTGAGAAVELQVGDRARIEVAERSQLAVREVTRSVHRFRLARGRLSAEYGSDGTRLLRVEGADGEVVEASHGRVGVLQTGGSLTVAAQSGSATLHAAGRTVEIGAGLQVVAAHASAPSAAEPIPVDVLLRIANPDRPLPGDRTARVRGTATPGTRVQVNGLPAEVDAAGSFAVVIPVRIGKNRVVAIVEDALGRTTRRTLPPIVIEPKADIRDVSIRWGKTDAPL